MIGIDPIHQNLVTMSCLMTFVQVLTSHTFFSFCCLSLIAHHVPPALPHCLSLLAFPVPLSLVTPHHLSPTLLPPLPVPLSLVTHITPPTAYSSSRLPTLPTRQGGGCSKRSHQKHARQGLE